MLRRLNFTNRKRILRKNYSISIIGEKDEPKSFDAFFDFDDLNLLGDSIVIVEAWHRMMQSQRYSFGLIDELVPPDDTTLGLLGLAENVKFRVFVVDEFGKILASSSRISITQEEKKASLLPVEVTDLDNLLWKISMEGDDGGPILELNERVPTIKTVAAYDPRFIHSVYPAVLRQILIQIAVLDDINLRSPVADWQSNWISFTENIFSAPPEGRFSVMKDDVLQWIEGAVQAFGRYRKRDWNNKLLEWEP